MDWTTAEPALGALSVLGAELDVSGVGPTIGVGVLLLWMLRFMWQEVSDRRKFEAHLREEFAEERRALRLECAEERREDRTRIAALEAEISRLRDQLEGRR